MSNSTSADDVACGCGINQEDENLIICRCEEVTRAEVISAVRQGARTVDEVKRRTRAGMGLCQSKTCSRLVQRIISEHTGAPLADIQPSSARPPVRPIPIRVLAAFEQEE